MCAALTEWLDGRERDEMKCFIFVPCWYAKRRGIRRTTRLRNMPRKREGKTRGKTRDTVRNKRSRLDGLRLHEREQCGPRRGVYTYCTQVDANAMKMRCIEKHRYGIDRYELDYVDERARKRTRIDSNRELR